MIKVTYGTTTQKSEAVVSSSTIIRDFCDEHNIDYGTATPFLDGKSVSDINKTFAECGVTEKCLLLSVTKSVNA